MFKSKKKEKKKVLVVTKLEKDPVDKEETELIAKLRAEFKEEGVDKVTDQTLLRFIRGFSGHPTDPLGETKRNLSNFLKWRKDEKIDELCETKLPHELEFRKMWRSGIHGFDKTGHPIYIECPGKVDIKKIFAAGIDTELMGKFHIQSMEEICRLKDKLAEERKCNAYKHTVILDLKGLSAKHVGSKFRNPLKAMISLDQAMYPEGLHRLVIVNAPMLIKGVWKMLSPFVDPVTKSRILWGKSKLPELVDADQIPVFLGGACKCKDGNCCIEPFVAGDSGAKLEIKKEEVASQDVEAEPSISRKDGKEGPSDEEGGDATGEEVEKAIESEPTD